VCRAIAQPATDGRRCRTLDEFIGSPVSVVDEEDATSRSQAVIDERPERVKAFERDMREPESEKDDVITTVWPPREQIGEDEPDTIVFADRRASDRQHLRGGVDGGHTRGVLEHPMRPRPWSACQLEHVAGRREAVQRGLKLRAAR
jgi:hypothetical protein